jgi:hypothetical protein
MEGDPTKITIQKGLRKKAQEQGELSFYLFLLSIGLPYYKEGSKSQCHKCYLARQEQEFRP